ncbi:uncharacterized protein LOC141660151 [Apium graveolens]|uniref:uncharacterized protein LOC141660151 n=1 Tax=Apium graveolens TaxID=4045 RepID=UPI003D7961CC
MTDYHTVPPPPPEDKKRVPQAGSIHIILGGSHIGGDSRKAMDIYAREAKDKPLTNVNHLSQRPPELFEREADDIVFKENDAKWVHYPHTDALVIKIKIGTVNVHRAMVDTGSSADVLTYDAYKKLGLLDRELTSTGGHLYGFTGNSIGVKGTIRLPITIGEEPHVATQIALFTVVDQPCAYNVIVGRPLMRAMRMVTSIHHMTIKFPTPTGVGFLKSCQYESRVCYNQALRVAESGSASKEMVEPGEGDVLMEEAEGRKRVRPEGHETCNLISIEELPENYFEHMGIQVELHPGALLMEASQPIILVQEGIVEEASDEEESPEQIAVRLRKGKWAREETTITMDLPNGITRTVTTTSERLINPARAHQPELEDTKGLTITEMGKSSEARADLDPRMPPMVERVGAAEDTILIVVDPNDPFKVLRIGSDLSPDLREDLARFLRENLDVFAWLHSAMIGIDPNVMCHRLNLDPKKKGVRQKRRPISGERAEALREEVDRLMEAGLVREAFYPMWLANPVLVKKPNGKWRTCVDFTDLNKACPNDNQEHTSFITDRGLYCYIGMPFGLLNAGATYQRLVNKMFKHQLGKTMKAYVDDMLVKSKEARDHVRHLAELFQILREYRMKLNPQKCVFGVESGKFLGFIVNRGIEANPTKIRALLEMRSPRRVKDVQSLTGRVASLNRFVSKSSNKCKEFFKEIKGVGRNIKWTKECEEAF